MRRRRADGVIVRTTTSFDKHPVETSGRVRQLAALPARLKRG